MAVITQEYDIDLKATGAFPVVKCSQFDTGSRKIVFTVFDGWDLADISGCLARVDGTRSDGVEFSQSCTVTDGSKVSVTISQEMTKSAGKHSAELVLFDASGNPIGTQNFMIEVEPATMRRDSAVSADDRTLYDQYTQSIDDKFSGLSASVTKTVEDISALIGASSEPIVVFSDNVGINNGTTNSIAVRVTYDPITALVHCWINGTFQPKSTTNNPYRLCEIPIEYCPSEDDFAFDPYTYVISQDNIYELVSGDSSPDANKITYSLVQKDDGEESSYLQFAIGAVARMDALYEIALNATWYARGGKYIGVTPLPGGGTGGSGYVLPPANATTLGGVKVGSGLAVTDDGQLSADHSGAGTDSIAIGAGTQASGTWSTAVGRDSTASGTSSVALGGGRSKGVHSLAILAGASAKTDHNIAIGMNSNASSNYDIAVGHSAVANGGSSVAVGIEAKASGSKSVAIGYGSEAPDMGTVSVGSSSLKRRIVNVKDPTSAQDAATKAYVDALIAKLKSDNGLK